VCGRRFDAPDEGPKQALPTAVSKAPITLLMRVEIADDTLTTAHMMGMSNVMIGTQTKRRETTTARNGALHTFHVNTTADAIEAGAADGFAVRLRGDDEEHMCSGDGVILVSGDGCSFLAEVYDADNGSAYLDIR